MVESHVPRRALAHDRARRRWREHGPGGGHRRWLGRGSGRRLAALGICLTACSLVWARGARAEEPTLSLTPSVAPDRLGASAAFTLNLRFGGGEEGVPPPLRQVAVRVPAGVRVTVAGVRVCSPARLRSRGPSGCPHGSQVGRGHALLRVHAGSQAVPEQAALWVFRGPDHGGQPAFLIFGRGYTPLYQSAVSTETLETEEPPYGWRTVTSVPLIPTVMYEPDASFLSVTVTVGGSPPSRGHPTPGRIVLPASCPPGGFPFAAQASFLGGAVASASATVPCP